MEWRVPGSSSGADSLPIFYTPPRSFPPKTYIVGSVWQKLPDVTKKCFDCFCFGSLGTGKIINALPSENLRNLNTLEEKKKQKPNSREALSYICYGNSVAGTLVEKLWACALEYWHAWHNAHSACGVTSTELMCRDGSVLSRLAAWCRFTYDGVRLTSHVPVFRRSLLQWDMELLNYHTGPTWLWRESGFRVQGPEFVWCPYFQIKYVWCENFFCNTSYFICIKIASILPLNETNTRIISKYIKVRDRILSWSEITFIIRCIFFRDELFRVFEEWLGTVGPILNVLN